MGSFSRLMYRGIRRMVQWIYPKTTVEGLERLPDGPCILVGNHAQIHGPIACELYLPGQHYTWCAAEMMHLKQVPDYAYRDFWSGKPKGVRWVYRIASFAIAPLAVCVFNNANCIGVYRDAHVLSTFRETLKKLNEGARVVIFPEELQPGNGVVWHFQRGFVDVARLYAGREGRRLPFVPMYVCPALHKIILGEPMVFDPAAPIGEERERLCEGLSEAIAELARSQPPHTIVPYPNIPKHQYPASRPTEDEHP